MFSPRWHAILRSAACNNRLLFSRPARLLPIWKSTDVRNVLKTHVFERFARQRGLAALSADHHDIGVEGEGRVVEGGVRVCGELDHATGDALGARDGAAMLEMALRHENAWLGIHGQSVSALDTMIDKTGGERLLFGSDWPFYHIGMSLAKVLLCTEAPAVRTARERILRTNALELLGSS